MASLVESLRDPSIPTFLLGEVPPGEGTPPGQALEICRKFVQRSRTMACDGYIVYDIQDEEGRSKEQRPFPFRKLMDPSGYASLVSKTSGKPCLIYKCIADDALCAWLETCERTHGHRAVNVVGRATSAPGAGPTMAEAMRIVGQTGLAFGAVCIAERHTPDYAAARGYRYPREHLNMIRKMHAGAEWFVSQAVYDAGPTVALLKDYAAACRQQGLRPKKVVLTFTPVSREKTLRFVKWLGVTVPAATEAAIMQCDTNEARVDKSIDLLCQVLDVVLAETAHLDVPLGINVESVSIYKAEINAVHDLFAKLQQRMLDARNIPWTIAWVRADSAASAGGRQPQLEPSQDPTPRLAAPVRPQSPLVVLCTGAAIMALGVLLGGCRRR